LFTEKNKALFNTLLQSTSEISLVRIADTAENNNVVSIADLQDGDAFSSNSNQDVDDGEEEVASNLRIQRIGLGGRSYKRRRA
jgi:hypothetical protein